MKKLFKNTIYLYVLQFSLILFSFVTLPYQARIFGPEVFGLVGFAMAVMAIVQLFIDFGFMLSATAEVSLHRASKFRISQILTTVTLAKVLLGCIAGATLVVALYVLNVSAYDKWFYVLFFLATLVTSLIPDYIYRGVEDMTSITTRTVVIRALFVVLVFAFLRDESQYILIPIFYLLVNALALVFALIHLDTQKSIKMTKITKKDLLKTIKQSSMYFMSRIATTVYGSMNSIILKLFVSQFALGIYVSVDKLITASRSAMSPIADSLYPYMIKHKNYRLVKKILLIATPLLAIVAVLIWVYADAICLLIFGAQFIGAGDVLRTLLPIIVITLPTYLLGFPVLGAMGHAKHANYSVILGAFSQASLLVLLIITQSVSVYSVAWITLITEILVLSYRIIAVKVFIKRA